MADRVLPALLVFPIVRKSVHDELVYPVESDPFVLGVLDGHGDKGYIRVRWFHHVFGGVVQLVWLMVRPRSGRVPRVPRVLVVRVGRVGPRVRSRRRDAGGARGRDRLPVVRILVFPE